MIETKLKMMVMRTFLMFYYYSFIFLVLGSNFDLIFKRQSSKDMVLLPDGQNIPSMTGFTIAQFVQADSKYKSGTLFSYSVPENPEDIIILSFTESQIILAIKNEEVRADFRLADDNWHFVGVIWDGGLGSASVYIDGMEIAEVSNLQAENIIRGGGWIALGQRYLAEQKITALSSAFVGRLDQVSIWNVAATRDHMWNAAHDCSWPIAGSLRAWSSFLPGIKGQVEKRFMTQCKGIKYLSNSNQKSIFLQMYIDGIPFQELRDDKCSVHLKKKAEENATIYKCNTG